MAAGFKKGRNTNLHICAFNDMSSRVSMAMEKFRL